MAYRFNNEDEVRDGFWYEHDYEPRGNGRQNEQPAEVRMAFVDWIDGLQKSGQISEELADMVTL